MSVLRDMARNRARTNDPDEVFKVWPTNVDREHFRRVMLAGAPDDLREQYDGKAKGETGHAIADAYFFFFEKIAEWLGPAGSEQQTQRLDALVMALYRGIMVVVIDLDNANDAQTIFETLNARGTPLLASDLVKNLLLRGAEAEGLDVEALYYKYWHGFDDQRFWRKEIRQGRLNRPRIEIFLQHYLAMRSAHDVTAVHLFDSFRQYLKDNAELSIEDHLAALQQYGTIYRQFYQLPDNTRESLFFRRVEALDTTTIFPLMLLVFDKLGSPAQTEQRRTLLIDIESFLVRRAVCELTPKNYNNLFLEACKAVAPARPEEVAGTVRHFLLGQTAEIGRWPNDEQFLEAWSRLEAYKRLRPQIRLRMILEALELKKRSTGFTEETALGDKRLSVEHILPRGWRRNWPLRDDSPEARHQRDTLLHSFGNLTLVNKRLNSKLSDQEWQKKRKTLQKHSVMLLHSDLQDLDTWDETHIRKRGKELFALAKAVWPRPQ